MRDIPRQSSISLIKEHRAVHLPDHPDEPTTIASRSSTHEQLSLQRPCIPRGGKGGLSNFITIYIYIYSRSGNEECMLTKEQRREDADRHSDGRGILQIHPSTPTTHVSYLSRGSIGFSNKEATWCSLNAVLHNQSISLIQAPLSYLGP